MASDLVGIILYLSYTLNTLFMRDKSDVSCVKGNNSCGSVCGCEVPVQKGDG